MNNIANANIGNEIARLIFPGAVYNYVMDFSLNFPMKGIATAKIEVMLNENQIEALKKYIKKNNIGVE